VTTSDFVLRKARSRSANPVREKALALPGPGIEILDGEQRREELIGVTVRRGRYAGWG
jgi:hypothetical protein